MTSIDPPSLQPTRHSLLSRLRDWNNQDSWQEFFNTYGKLIYAVARKAGLDDAEAQDAVQDTILCVSKQMADFKYDRARGSFKGWLKTRHEFPGAQAPPRRGEAAGGTRLMGGIKITSPIPS